MLPLPAAVAAALLIAAAPAFAQDGGVVSTAHPDPAGMNLPIEAPPPAGMTRADPARLDLANKVYALIGRETLATTTRSLRASMSVQLAQSMDDKGVARAKAMVEAVSDGLAAVSPQVSADTTYMLAKDFTADQLRDMLAFYQSPTGRAVIAKMPLLSQQSLAATLNYLPQMMDAVRDSYCHRIKCSGAEKKAFAHVSERLAAEHPST